MLSLFISNLKSLKYTGLVLERIGQYRESSMLPSEIIMEVKNDLDKTFLDNINTLDDLTRYSR